MSKLWVYDLHNYRGVRVALLIDNAVVLETGRGRT